MLRSRSKCGTDAAIAKQRLKLQGPCKKRCLFSCMNWSYCNCSPNIETWFTKLWIREFPLFPVLVYGVWRMPLLSGAFFQNFEITTHIDNDVRTGDWSFCRVPDFVLTWCIAHIRQSFSIFACVKYQRGLEPPRTTPTRQSGVALLFGAGQCGSCRWRQASMSP